jgi:hypothetical protein
MHKALIYGGTSGKGRRIIIKNKIIGSGNNKHMPATEFEPTTPSFVWRLSTTDREETRIRNLILAAKATLKFSPDQKITLLKTYSYVNMRKSRQKKMLQKEGKQ